jgi:hypothetical protein
VSLWYNKCRNGTYDTFEFHDDTPCTFSLLVKHFIKSLEITSLYTFSEELHNLYTSPNIIRMIKLRRMRWPGHIARIERRGMHVGFWWESQKERDH